MSLSAARRAAAVRAAALPSSALVFAFVLAFAPARTLSAAEAQAAAAIDVAVVLDPVPGEGVRYETLSGGFDRLELDGSRGFVAGLSEVDLPDGWSLERGRKGVALEAKPGTSLAGPLRFRLRAAFRPALVDWKASRAGKEIAARVNVVPRVEAPIEARTSLEGLALLPDRARAGDRLAFRTLEALPPGRFEVAGVSAAAFPLGDWRRAISGSADGSLAGATDVAPRIHVVDLPATLAPGAAVALRYVDRFGDLLVDVPDTRVTIVAPSSRAAEGACVEAATPLAEPGDPVCACGSFAAPADAFGLYVDETPIAPDAYLSSAGDAVVFRLPDKIAAGRHAIAATPTAAPVEPPPAVAGVAAEPESAAGEPAPADRAAEASAAVATLDFESGAATSDTVSAASAASAAAPAETAPALPACAAETRVLKIRGAVDSEKLLGGETTPMRIEIDGTTAPVTLRIRNHTPEIVRVEGGDDQLFASDGGDPNLVVRDVSGLVRGAFRIDWKLPAPTCPCGR